MILFRSYTFEAAHFLPLVGKGHKCSRLHGHSYRVEVQVSGPVDPRTGWVMDLDAIDSAWAPVNEQLDHHSLNQIGGIANPTVENIAAWIWQRLKPGLPQLSRLTIQEMPGMGCIYEGPQP